MDEVTAYPLGVVPSEYEVVAWRTTRPYGDGGSVHHEGTKGTKGKDR